jgi:hypothetical protein
MKNIALSLALTGTLLASQLTAQAPLPLFKETAHFSVHCLAGDQAAADTILATAEQNFAQLTQLFNHTYSAKITLNVFPSVQALHSFLGCTIATNGESSGPAWLINNYDEKDHSFSTVSLSNPGTYHTADSILKFNITGLSYLFIKDSYQNSIPYWLVHGFGLAMVDPKYTARYQAQLTFLANHHSYIPALKQMETYKFIEFAKVYGHACSYSLVAFMQQTWGQDKVLALMADYTALERILGIDEETFRAQWIAYLDQKYLTAK